VRTFLFWVITQRVVVISYGRFGTNYRSHLHVSGIQKVFDSWLLKMGPLVYPEMSERNYHYSLRNNPVLIYFAKEAWNQAPKYRILLFL
jgi:hypothetical protein